MISKFTLYKRFNSIPKNLFFSPSCGRQLEKRLWEKKENAYNQHFSSFSNDAIRDIINDIEDESF